jgi:hypothetical protein
MVIIMGKQNKSIRDTWGKLDVIFKGFAGVLIPLTIALYGFQSNKTQTKIAEVSKQAQVLVETMNQRETSASSLRAQMFNTLMQHYFKEEDEKRQPVLLELIGLNFQDHLHLKPLFENLDVELQENPEERIRLRKAAKRILRNEVEKIVGSGGEVIESELHIGEPWYVEPYNIINLTLLDVQEDRIRVTSNPEEGGDGFEVRYYDLPVMDNSKLGELTYSVLLSDVDVDNNKAKVKVVILPKHFYSSRNSLRFDALIGDLLERVESE